ncbi:DUF3418 domain-containing protein [Escherichia coli]|nr:DUF3418 domain-containing protein [Escherichia coli]
MASPIVAARKVNYSQIDPALCRNSLFATRWWKVTGRRVTHSSVKTWKLRAEVEELEHKTRRRDILVDDETLFEFTTSASADDGISARHSTAGGKSQPRNA